MQCQPEQFANHQSSVFSLLCQLTEAADVDGDLQGFACGEPCVGVMSDNTHACTRGLVRE